ncbi:MAG: hypothetical protein LWX83_17425, partial [Anaerolineae bacterium]|nr:hypothetical protein [Anaerolineae bacterium]
IQDVVHNWAWWAIQSPSATIDQANITPRMNGFITGFELAPQAFDKSIHFLPDSLHDMRLVEANRLILTPLWKVNDFPFSGPDKFSAINDNLLDILLASKKEGLSVSLFPQFVYPGDSNEWWENANRDSTWWEQWFKSYRSFALHYAALASKNDCQSLILGGPAVFPALPSAKLRSGSASNVPSDVLQRWLDIIRDVRKIYHGQIWWAIADSDLLSTSSQILEQADVYYYMVSTPDSDNLDHLFSQEIEPFAMISQKPIVIALEYPSTEGESFCVWRYSNRCSDGNLPGSAIYTPQKQMDNYQAVLNHINNNGLIFGLISRGFSPSGPLLDSSPSVYGKPTFDLLWYWFTNFRPN